MTSELRVWSRIAGLLLFTGLLLTLWNNFFATSPQWLEGVLLWLAGLILFFGLATMQKTVIAVLGIGALISWTMAWKTGDVSDMSGALTMNQSMIVMLIGVHFLQLVAIPKYTHQQVLPSGKDAFTKTYAGVHLFGSVINLSSVMLVADRLVLDHPLSKQQQMLLTRAFSSAANWSPFFAAFAAAMVFAPGSSLLIVIFTGMTMACIAFLLTFFELNKQDEGALKDFVGYPMDFHALWLPALLAVLVMAGHNFIPGVKVIILIAMFAVFLSAVVLSVRLGLLGASKRFGQHVIDGLPGMKNELLLFLVAGVFGAGLAAVLEGLSISVPFSQFDGVVACAILLSIVVFAIMGVHPVVSIAVIGHWISSTNPNETLLAMTFLMSWALSVSTSPFSGINLALHGRYGVSGQAIFKWNLSYTLKMFCVNCLVLLFVGYFFVV